MMSLSRVVKPFWEKFSVSIRFVPSGHQHQVADHESRETDLPVYRSSRKSRIGRRHDIRVDPGAANPEEAAERMHHHVMAMEENYRKVGAV